jgi:GNAT superfamily N-acetyltransferase
MPEDPSLEVRPIALTEMKIILQWADDEGWNPGLDDADAFYAADPKGFLIALLDGVPVASISVVRYGRTFGFLGLYIVAPPYRGRGFGMRLWQAGMTHLDGRTVGLDGVVAQQANYARSGFALAHRNIRYSGYAPRSGFISSPDVCRIGANTIEAVVAYDRTHFPEERESFLRVWLRQGRGRRSMAHMRDDTVRGYVVIRASRNGYKVGPLFADTELVAKELFTSALAEAAGARISIDVPEPNEKAADLASGVGLVPVFETARMYRGQAPELRLDEIYGWTSLELG